MEDKDKIYITKTMDLGPVKCNETSYTIDADTVLISKKHIIEIHDLIERFFLEVEGIDLSKRTALRQSQKSNND